MSLALTSDPARQKEVLAASAPWLAAWLNVFPGLGAGYIYQRRWRAYWITVMIAGLFLGVGLLPKPLFPDLLAPWNPLPGLVGLAALTAGEAFLAGRRARMN